jgi:hypothetical protein
MPKKKTKQRKAKKEKQSETDIKRDKPGVKERAWTMTGWNSSSTVLDVVRSD